MARESTAFADQADKKEVKIGDFVFYLRPISGGESSKLVDRAMKVTDPRRGQFDLDSQIASSERLKAAIIDWNVGKDGSPIDIEDEEAKAEINTKNISRLTDTIHGELLNESRSIDEIPEDVEKA